MSPSLYVGIDMVTLWGPIWWTSKIVSFYLWLSTHPNNTVIVSRMSFATTLWTVPKGYRIDFNHFPSGTVGIQDLIWLVKTCACRQLFGIIWKNIKMYMNLLVIYNKHVWFANLLSIRDTPLNSNDIVITSKTMGKYSKTVDSITNSS